MTTQARYINIAIIHQDGGASSSQIWTNDPAEAMKAFEGLLARAMRDRNPAILGAICDPFAPLVRYQVLDMRATVIV